MSKYCSKTRSIEGSVSLAIVGNKMPLMLRNISIIVIFRHPKSKWSLLN